MIFSAATGSYRNTFCLDLSMRGQPAAPEDMLGKQAYDSVGNDLTWPLWCERKPPGPKLHIVLKVSVQAIEHSLCISNQQVVYDINWSADKPQPYSPTLSYLRQRASLGNSLTCGNRVSKKKTFLGACSLPSKRLSHNTHRMLIWKSLTKQTNFK